MISFNFKLILPFNQVKSELEQNLKLNEMYFDNPTPQDFEDYLSQLYDMSDS